MLQGLKLSGHTDTLTKVNNLIEEIYKRGEIQNDQQYGHAPDKIHIIEMELPSKLLGKNSFQYET